MSRKKPGQLLKGLPVADWGDGGVASELLAVPYAVSARGAWLHFTWWDLRRFPEKLWRSRRAPQTVDGYLDRAQAHGRGSFHLRTVPPDLLDRFIKVGDCSDPRREVVRFASEHGVLDLCGHGLPVTHRSDRQFSRFWLPECWPVGSEPVPWRDRRRGREPFSKWILYARAALGAIRIGERLGRGQPGRSSDWAMVESVLPPLRSDWSRTMLEGSGDDDRLILAHFVNSWLAIGAAGPMLRNRGRRLVYLTGGRYGTRGQLWAALGLQLALRVCSGHVHDVPCTVCGGPTSPDRRPNPFRDHFCDGCAGQRHEPQKRANRRHRERAHEATELVAKFRSSGLGATAAIERAATVLGMRPRGKMSASDRVRALLAFARRPDLTG